MEKAFEGYKEPRLPGLRGKREADAAGNSGCSLEAGLPGSPESLTQFSHLKMLPNKGDDLHRAAAIGGDAPDILPRWALAYSPYYAELKIMPSFLEKPE
jgi:hypothetical protein